MFFPIARIFETEENARQAERLLLADGFPSTQVHVVSGATEEAVRDRGALANAVKAGSALREHVEIYADEVARGRVLVVVSASFGTGGSAARILDSCGPLELVLPGEEVPETDWNEATPLSALLRMPVLIRDQPAPLSDYIGIPAVTRGLSCLARLFRPLTAPDFSLSRMFGMPLLSSNPAPLSSMFGMKTLSQRPPGTRWTTSLGFPLLSNSAAPLSNTFGLPLLSRNPAPLSRMLGLKTLSD